MQGTEVSLEQMARAVYDAKLKLVSAEMKHEVVVRGYQHSLDYVGRCGAEYEELADRFMQMVEGGKFNADTGTTLSGS